MFKRNFTEDEIEDILESVKKRYNNVLTDVVDCLYKDSTNNLRKSLKKIVMDPSKYDDIKKLIVNKYEDAMIESGVHVGVIAGQSLGQPMTQMALSSFKKTGSKEFDDLNSVSNIKQILRWSDNTSGAKCVVHIKDGFDTDVRSMKIYSRSIKSVKIGDVVQSAYVEGDTVNLTLDSSKRFDLRINVSRVARLLEKEIRLKTTVVSEIFSMIKVVSKDSSRERNMSKSNSLAKFMNFSNTSFDPVISGNHIDFPLFSSIMSTVICGIPEATDVGVGRKKLTVTGPVFGEVMGFSFTDTSKSMSYNVKEMYETLGIEATRSLILERICTLAGMSKSDKNVRLLADQICARGIPASVDRKGMNKINAGYLRSLSFENGTQVLRKAVSKMHDPLVDPSSKILTGKML